MIFRTLSARTWVIALSCLIVGIGAIYWGANAAAPWRSVLLTNVGSFLIASIAMALIFEFWQLRSLVDDLFRHAKIAEEVSRAKLVGFSIRFHDGIDWGQLFNASNRLDIFFAYGRTWRNSHQEHLRELLAVQGSEVAVVLPDPDAEVPLAELARRFQDTPEQLKVKIAEAHSYFVALATAARGRVVIYSYPGAPLFSFYRFNSKVVFASYRHRPDRGPILTLVAERGGEFYDWVREEWVAVAGASAAPGLARIVFDSSTDLDTGH